MFFLLMIQLLCLSHGIYFPGFSRQAELNSHLESHVDGKKHQCDICQKFFKSKNSLKTHRKGHSEGNVLM